MAYRPLVKNVAGSFRPVVRDVGGGVFRPVVVQEGHAADCDCCGAPDCEPCGFCDVTPCTIEVTITGATPCICMAGTPLSTSFLSVDSGDLNGTYTLVQDPLDACLWVSDTDVVVGQYSATPCPGTRTGFYDDYRIYLRKLNATTWRLRIERFEANAPLSWQGLFSGSGTVDSLDCDSELDIDNDITDCYFLNASGDFHSMYTGGTAHVTPIT